MTVLEKIRSTFQEKKDHETLKYAELVVAIATDGEVDTLVATRIMESADKSYADFNDDVSIKRHRLKYASDLKASEDSANEISKLNSQIQQLAQKRDKILRKAEPFNRQIQSLEAERVRAGLLTGNAHHARKSLRETAPQKLKDAVEKLRARKSELNADVRGLEDNLKLNRDNMSPWLKARPYAERRHKHNLLGIPENLAAIEKRITDYQKAITGMQTKLDCIAQTNADLEKQIQSVHEQMLVP